MSGIVQNNILRSSGTVAVSAAGLNWSDTIITGSTATVEAGNGYWINTTSNTCTITLPSSAESGDQIVLIDYARTWGTNSIFIDSNGLNYQGNDDTYTVEYNTDGQSVNIVYSDATKGWLPLEDDVTALEPTAPPTQKGLFAYGYTTGVVSMSNLVSSSGVVATDVTGVGTARRNVGAASYGGDKAIFGYGFSTVDVSLTNLVSNSGVVSADVTGVGTARRQVGATTYGTDKAIFGYGYNGSSMVSLTNLVSNSGVVATDTAGVGTAQNNVSASGYGSTGQAIFGYGTTTGDGSGRLSLTNLVTNVGVVGTDVTGVGTARYSAAAASYGGDKAIFGYGADASDLGLSMTNLVNNSGVVASDTTGVGTARQALAATNYGGDKGIFGYGTTGSVVSLTNLISNSGVVAADVTGVGSPRWGLGAAGYSYSA
jgi:hypothetical protein